MIQTLINALLGLGYVIGLVLVWIGLEMFVIDGRAFAPSCLSLVAGIGLWAILVALGKSLHRRSTRSLGAPQAGGPR